jgi:ligand-binding sensor domain-containing protein/signal transduction histidine kinase
MPIGGACKGLIIAASCGIHFVSAARGADDLWRPVNLTSPELEYSCLNWGKEQGLPDNEVRALLQTRDGYLWVGTRTGLARFDGVRFTRIQDTALGGLENTHSICLAEDQEGAVLVGTDDGLHRWTKGTTTRFHFGPGASCVTALFLDSQGRVWVGNWKGTHRFQGGHLVRYKAGDFDCSGLHEDAAGTLWLNSEAGLWRYQPDQDTFAAPIRPPAFEPESLYGIASSPDGRLWTLFRPRGLEPNMAYLWSLEAGQWRCVLDQRISNDARPLFITTDRHGNLWLPTGKGTLLQMRDGQITRYAMPEALEDYAVCFLEDREGNLWFGTEKSGLHCWQQRKSLAYTRQDGLPDDRILAVCQTRDGAVWIGTDSGLGRFWNGTWTNYSTEQGLACPHVRALAEDGAGRLWVGTRDGLSCWDGGRFTNFRFEGEWFNTKVRALLVAGDETLWVGTVSGLRRVNLAGLALNTPTGGTNGFQILPDSVVPFHTNGLSPRDDVRVLLEDRTGAVWIGTQGGGLNRWREGRFATFSMRDGLSSDFVWALHQDADGVLWIGTNHGLNRLKEGKISAFTVREGLPDNPVNQILEDDYGWLWVSHDRGIYRVRKQELHEVAEGRRSSLDCVAYEEADGLLTSETNGQFSQPAGCKTRDGRLWFPTPRGVLVIDPANPPDNTNPPPVVIEQIRANAQVLFDNAAGAKRLLVAGAMNTSSPRAANVPKVSSLHSEVHLPPGSAHILEVFFTANTFIAADKVRFKYRLEGLDKDWIDAGTRRAAYYANLRPGHFRFRVRAGNKYGVWNETGASFGFHLQPHFHQTRTFYALSVLGVGAALLGFYRWRLGYLRRIQHLEQQASLERERARIAKDLHDGLGADLTQLSLLADLAEQGAAAGADAHTRKLSRSAREMAHVVKDTIWVANPADTTLRGLIGHIADRAEQLLGAAGIRCRFDVPAEFPSRPLDAEVRRNLFLAAKEALNNIARHAGASEAHVRAALADSTLTLAIEDNGRGFNPQQPPAGHGLTNMRRRVQEGGGEFRLESEPGRGTRIRIQVKLREEKP